MQTWPCVNMLCCFGVQAQSVCIWFTNAAAHYASECSWFFLLFLIADVNSEPFSWMSQWSTENAGAGCRKTTVHRWSSSYLVWKEAQHILKIKSLLTWSGWTSQLGAVKCRCPSGPLTSPGVLTGATFLTPPNTYVYNEILLTFYQWETSFQPGVQLLFMNANTNKL